MLWFGVESQDNANVDLTGILEVQTFAALCYRLVDDDVPLATIVERFSADLFGD